MFLSRIDECEIIYVVNGCKSKTSTDCDDIDFRLIKSIQLHRKANNTYI